MVSVWRGKYTARLRQVSCSSYTSFRDCACWRRVWNSTTFQLAFLRFSSGVDRFSNFFYNPQQLSEKCRQEMRYPPNCQLTFAIPTGDHLGCYLLRPLLDHNLSSTPPTLHVYKWIIKMDKKEILMRISRGIQWENTLPKLKRSIRKWLTTM